MKQIKSVVTGYPQNGSQRERVYGRTELQGPALQAASLGQSCTLHCSLSGGLSRISQLRSVNLSPLGRWHTTSRVLVPAPHGFVHWKSAKDRAITAWVAETLLTSHAKHYHLLRPNSCFSSQPTHSGQIPPTTRFMSSDRHQLLQLLSSQSCSCCFTMILPDPT